MSKEGYSCFPDLEAQHQHFKDVVVNRIEKLKTQFDFRETPYPFHLTPKVVYNDYAYEYLERT